VLDSQYQLLPSFITAPSAGRQRGPEQCHKHSSSLFHRQRNENNSVVQVSRCFLSMVSGANVLETATVTLAEECVALAEEWDHESMWNTLAIF